MATKAAKVELKIGAVAYAPKVITIWEGMREYLRGQGLMTEYVLYASYPALVDALVAGHIDIAWNTPLAYLQVKEQLGGQCLVLGRRNSDMGFSTVFIARADSSIHSLGDLKATRFALGSRDSSHAAILPVHFLHAAGLEADKDLKLVRFDSDIGKHGDTGTSEQDVVRAVMEGSAEAGAIGKATLDAFVANGSIDPRSLRIFWTSHGYSHCNFTARAGLAASLAERFTKAIEAMDYNDPKWKQVMNLEGLTGWMPGSTEGYDELEREARRLDMLSELA
jgi:ABC-type phosphate/phosphonate transport system substrate-binding protein